MADEKTRTIRKRYRYFDKGSRGVKKATPYALTILGAFLLGKIPSSK